MILHSIQALPAQTLIALEHQSRPGAILAGTAERWIESLLPGVQRV